MKRAQLSLRARRVASQALDGVARQLRSTQLGPPAGGADLREPSLVAWAQSVQTHTFIPAQADRRRSECAFVIRPAQPGDQARIAEGYARLSDRSKYLRFLGVKPALSTAELDELTHADHRDRVTLIALSQADGRVVGTAQYVRHCADSDLAEIAVAVIDEWHRRGVATALLNRLVDHAHRTGIRRFDALIADRNVAALGLMQRLGFASELIDHDEQAFEFHFLLDGSDDARKKRPAQPCL